MIFLIDSKSILDCRTYSILRPHQFDVVAILEYFKQQLQSSELKEESNILDKLKTLANVLLNSNKSQILRLIQVFTSNSSENKQIFETFKTSSCSQWFIEQLYVDIVQIIFQQYLKNDQQFIGRFLKKIMNLYELDLQIQSGQYKNSRFKENHKLNQINQFKSKIDDNIKENNIKLNLKDDQQFEIDLQLDKNNLNTKKQIQVNKQKIKNINQDTNLIQSNSPCSNQQGQGNCSSLEFQKQQDQINDIISNILSKKSIDSQNLNEEQLIQKEQLSQQIINEDIKNQIEQIQMINHDKQEILNKDINQNTQLNYQIPEDEQQNIAIQKYTSLEGIYELLEIQYVFDSWWPEFKTQCLQCKNKEELFQVLNQKAPILIEKWTKIAEKSDSEERVEENDQEKQDKKQLNDCQIFQELDKNNKIEKSSNFENNQNIIIDQQEENIDKLQNNQQIQSQGNQTESKNVQSSQQLFMNQEFIQEYRFSQDYSDDELLNFENPNFSNLFIHSPSRRSSINYCSDEENFIFNKGNEEFNNQNQSQSDSVILDEQETKKSLITNLEQFYKSKLVENQPQHIFPELEYMGNTQKMVDKLLLYLDFEDLDIQIEDFLAQPQINPSKMLQEFVLTTYNIFKHITIHKYQTIIEVKQVEKEYLGSVIISQVNNKNKEIKKYKGPCLDIVNIITRLIAIKKLNNYFFSEGLESTSLCQIVMSIIKRLIPGRYIYKQITEKYKRIKTSTDKNLDKIIIVKNSKQYPELFKNQQNSKLDNQNSRYNLNQQSDTKRRNNDKRNYQRDTQSQIINTQINKRSNNYKNQNQYKSNKIYSQNQNNYNQQDSSFDYYSYPYDQQNQYQNQFLQSSQYKKILNHQNQPFQQGYQGISKNQQQQQSKFYQQSTQNQYAYNMPYHSNHIQYQDQCNFNNQNDMQTQPYFHKKSQKMYKENTKLNQYSQQKFQNQKRFSYNQQNNQYDQFNQFQQMRESFDDYIQQKQRKYDYHQQNESKNNFYQNQQQFIQENQYFNQQSYQIQNNQRPIDFQIIQKMVNKLMREEVK